jgi:hypothetical protein
MAGKRATKIDAMLRHLAAGGEAQDFPGTKYENMALARTIERRGLIAWDGEGNRHILTPAGWSELTPRRFGLPSLAVSTATGVVIGAAALAFLWLPDARWPVSAHGQPATVAVQSPVAVSVPIPADIGGRSVAPMSVSAPRASAAASTPPSGTSPVSADPVEPAQVATQPVSDQPSSEAAPTPAKQATRKHHRRTARPREQYNPFGNPWRGREYSPTRYGQGSWYAYR